MVFFRVRIRVDDAQRQDVLRSLMETTWQTQLLPGCIGAHVYCDVQEEQDLLILEEWRTQEHLVARLRGDSLRVVLAAIDCSTDPPEVRIDAVSETKGLEFISACRS